MLKSQVQAINEPPPRTWADYERGCVLTYRGGHEGKEAGAFVHGMRTVFALLQDEFPPAEICQAAPDLLAECKGFLAAFAVWRVDPDKSPVTLATFADDLRSAIAKAENTPTP